MTEEEEAKLVKKYGREVVDNGFEEFDKHCRDRKKELENLNNERIKQDINFQEHNKLFNDDKKWPYGEYLKKHDKKWDTDELEIAINSGFIKPEKDKETLKKEQIADLKKEFEKSVDRDFNKLSPSDKKLEEFKKNFEKGDNIEDRLKDLEKKKHPSSKKENAETKENNTKKELSAREKEIAAFKENNKSITEKNHSI